MNSKAVEKINTAKQEIKIKMVWKQQIQNSKTYK